MASKQANQYGSDLHLIGTLSSNDDMFTTYCYSGERYYLVLTAIGCAGVQYVLHDYDSHNTMHYYAGYVFEGLDIGTDELAKAILEYVCEVIAPEISYDTVQATVFNMQLATSNSVYKLAPYK